MKVHWFQHVPFEGLGAIEEWLLARGHTLSCTRFHADETPPVNSDGFEWLIVMGGPMNVYQYEAYPWLWSEKQVIREAITAGKRVLGICLGAQLIADVLGGEVYPNNEREIGWFPVRTVSAGVSSSFAFPEETYSLPLARGYLFTAARKCMAGREPWLHPSSLCGGNACAGPAIPFGNDCCRRKPYRASLRQ
jgi:GMP synthase-like glutamine amidotransferase